MHNPNIGQNDEDDEDDDGEEPMDEEDMKMYEQFLANNKQ